MRPENHPELRAMALFRGVAAETYEDLLRGAYAQTFPAGVELVTEGDHCDFLHVMLSGTAALSASWNGRETTLKLARRGASFVLAAVVRDLPYLMTARTVEKSRVLLIRADSLRAACARDGALALTVIDELAGGYRSTVRLLKDCKLRTSTERLANYLLQVAGDGYEAADLTIEKWRLASLLGMSAENLSRALASLREVGVSFNGTTLTVRDPAALRRLANPSPLIDGQDGWSGDEARGSPATPIRAAAPDTTLARLQPERRAASDWHDR